MLRAHLRRDFAAARRGIIVIRMIIKGTMFRKRRDITARAKVNIIFARGSRS
jgi:hypothetical protein